MKAKPMKRVNCVWVGCSVVEAEVVQLHVPGPYPTRFIPIHGKTGWRWNGDTKRPTLRPSILQREFGGNPRCHSYVTNGQIIFLKDCQHELAGQVFDLLDVED